MAKSSKERAESMRKRAWLIALVLTAVIGIPVLIAMRATSDLPLAALLVASGYFIVFSIFRWGTPHIYRAMFGSETSTSTSEKE
jgi:hypothetical protein